jgi:branched-chain amino acid transport system ATP-binding protein
MTAIQQRLERITGGEPIYPLALLFVLNFVDELDQVAFGVFGPNAERTFHTSETTITTIGTLSAVLVIMLIVPAGFVSDRYNRVRLALGAAGAWATMSVLTGGAGFIGLLWVLAIARIGSGLGRVMNEPVHASLLADYYKPEHHGSVFSAHRFANPFGAMLVLIAGTLGESIGWRATMMVLAIPTVVVLPFMLRLREPERGRSVDEALAAEVAEHIEPIPFGEAYRRLRSISTLRRFWFASFVLGGFIPLASLTAFFYENVYNVDRTGVWGRGGIAAVSAAGQMCGLVLSGRLSSRAIARLDFPRLATYAGQTLALSGLFIFGVAVSPWIGLSIAFSFLTGVAVLGFYSYYLPLVAAVSPPRLRSQGFAYAGLYFGLGGLAFAIILGQIGENGSYRTSFVILAVFIVLGGLIYRSAESLVQRDITSAFASLQAEMDAKQALDDVAGTLLLCRGVEVAYDQVQILFGVNMEVRRGEIVALLGTNGAGKSTLLKAISGIVDPIGGAILFDGRDITHADGVQTTSLGVIQVPGGKAVFPTLTVGEHLRAAGWLYRDDPDYLRAANEEVLEIFPRLRERIDQLAGNLSGGEQQMLALGMAFIAKPKLLMIDELSLGLAPTIVEQLLGIVRRIQANGTAIILVEQSINVALTVAERAYFLEKGEVRFEGATADLLERDDIVRSVFLEGAGATRAKARANGAPARARKIAVPADAPVVLEVVEITKRFGGIRAVDEATLTLREGEVLGLIGPNGAGKTTIFDLISGFLVPDEGRIRLDGEDVTDWTADRRAWLGLGRSFQDARLVPSLTVAENIAIGLERHVELRDHMASLLHLPLIVRQEEDVAWSVGDLVELMSLGAYRDKFVRELSTGTRRIVDLAMCIGHDPKVLLLDEPSSGIAQRETEALGPLLKRIQHDTGCALLVIEHDMPLITAVSDRMIALELGRPIAEGTPQQVIADPAVVSSYLGGDISAINRSGAGKAGGRSKATPRKTKARA